MSVFSFHPYRMSCHGDAQLLSMCVKVLYSSSNLARSSLGTARCDALKHGTAAIFSSDSSLWKMETRLA